MDSPPAVVNDVIDQLEAYMGDRLAETDLPPTLHDAVEYALFGGGKRLRPVLVVLSCEAAGGDRYAALPAAAAMELIHTFSLVHDDLPAMDDDDLRRGRPTLHVQSGEAMAILGGDAMICLAVTLASESPTSASLRVDIIRELMESTTQMIVGQVYDTLGGFSEEMKQQDRLDLVHRCKTGALIRASCRLGGHCAGADKHQMQALAAYGNAVGLMFQIVDDLLDVTQSTEHLGKATGKDLPAGKLTFPGIRGIEGSKSEIQRQRALALVALEAFDDKGKTLAELCEYMAIRTR